MKRIHIVGRKNHGKTTLIVELIGALRRQGLHVGTIKHASHSHELDAPGKDSHRQRVAGAAPVAIITPELVGLYMPRLDGDDFYGRLAPAFSGCDLVLVEGDLNAQAPKVEVWRASAGGQCLASGRSDIRVVITDDRPMVDVPLWPRSELTQLTEQLISLK